VYIDTQARRRVHRYAGEKEGTQIRRREGGYIDTQARRRVHRYAGEKEGT
jgi:hypothetical protein